MIGILLTSTCYYEGIDKQTFSDRAEELVKCIGSIRDHIQGPYELIIADNSPTGLVPTEQILAFCPKTTLFLRETFNPGKSSGEAALIRDGIYLSAARGHAWTFKLTGRYFLTGSWRIEDGIALLENSGKNILAKFIGKRMREIPQAKGHPLIGRYLDSDHLLGGIATQAFLANPSYLVAQRALQKEYLYREIPWVNFEQSFRHAVNGLSILHWPQLPIDGFVGNKKLGVPVQQIINDAHNPLYESRENYLDIPVVDISPLLNESSGSVG